jgi:16S rRNA (adenine1518-N6/adenine1519-N6)-dimethyltransferase
MKKLGQHFLKNIDILRTIADTLEIQKNEIVVEIGPGHGELTALLSHAAEGSGGGVIAIEKDHSLIAPLSAQAAKERPGLLTIIEGDALKLLSDIVATLHNYKIVGNIPYYITGKLLRIIGELRERPERTVLLIQKEVAERMCAVPPEMNRLAASVQFWAQPAIVAIVSRKDFSPPPDVDSAAIVLTNKKIPGGADPVVASAHYYRAVRGIFAQPRKTLLNNLVGATEGTSEKEAIIAHLKGMGINPGARPQDLSIHNIATIAAAPIWG